ncbi:MAG TPA: AAA family ATPase, partial [Polyangiales bacterium]|nr:AAA family ATPase [Polyangiales bacterium]
AVYAARDGASGARVALKRLHAGAWAAAALRREFRSLSRIVHPNLVALHELFCVRDQWFLTMELVEGAPLIEHLRAQGSALRNGVGEGALRDSFAQLLAGVAAIHDAGKLHRDLKPSNVLVAVGGRSVILDYGLVIDQGTALDETHCPGTPSYMAPEQLAGESATPAADLYAVGTMLFLALTGRLPQRTADPRAATPVALLRPSAWAPSIAEDLDRLCVELLAHDARERPSAAQARARVLGQRERVSGVHEALVPALHEPFVGRQAQLDALRDAFASLHEGPRVVWLHGESGMGKSALLRRFSAQQRSAGCLVLEGRCYERENTPFKVFDGVAEGLVRYLERMPCAEVERILPSRAGALLYVFPTFARLQPLASDRPSTPRVGDPLEQQRIAFTALRALLQRVCELQPVVIAVDDLQWGDVDSVRLLQSLLVPPNAPRQLFVGAFRSDETETSPFLRRALAPAGVSSLGCRVLEIALHGLDAREVAALVRQVGEGRSDALDASRLEPEIRNARGMPFLLCELLQHGARTEHSAIPDRIDEFVSSRAARCSAAGRRLLEVLCIAGRPLGLTLALHASALDEAAWPAASELCSLRLARWRDTDGERCIEPYHDYVRHTVCAHTGAAGTRSAQAGIAAAMQRLEVDEPEHLVEHLIAAGETLRAGRLAITAAERAELATAWHRASELYRAALTLVDAQSVLDHGLHERLAAALANASEHSSAADAYLASAQRAHGKDATRLQRIAAQQLMHAGRTQEGLALFKQLLRAVGFRYPEHSFGQLASFVITRGRIAFRERFAAAPKRVPYDSASEERMQTLRTAYRGIMELEPAIGSMIHARYVLEARSRGDRHALDALMWEIAHRAMLFGVTEEPKLAALVAEVRALARSLRTPYEAALALAAEGVYLNYCREQPRDALVMFERARDLLSECSGCYFERSWLSFSREYVLGVVGRLEEQFASCREREREARGREDGYTLRQLIPVLPLERLYQGKPDDALQFLDSHNDQFHVLGDFFEYTALLRRSDVHLYLGDERAAYHAFAEHWPRYARRGEFKTPTLRHNLGFFHARNAVALYFRTREPKLRRELDACVSYEPEVPVFGRALFRMLEACAARAEGRNAEARSGLLASLEQLNQTQSVHAAMCVRYRLGQLDGAREELARIHQWFAGQGVRDPEAWVALTVPGPRGWQPV